jgi:hypothetical protein
MGPAKVASVESCYCAELGSFCTGSAEWRQMKVSPDSGLGRSMSVSAYPLDICKTVINHQLQLYTVQGGMHDATPPDSCGEQACHHSSKL